MTEKIVHLRKDRIAWRALLHQVLERDGVEAIVMVVRIGDRWQTCWSNEANSGLAMAAMKLHHDITVHMHEDNE